MMVTLQTLLRPDPDLPPRSPPQRVGLGDAILEILDPDRDHDRLSLLTLTLLWASLDILLIG